MFSSILQAKSGENKPELILYRKAIPAFQLKLIPLFALAPRKSGATAPIGFKKTKQYNY